MTTTKVLVIGAGIVGLTIARELSKLGMAVTVMERAGGLHQGASGAGLGVLMAVCSSKPQGEIVQLRLGSLQKFDALITELEEELGVTIPYNTQGIVCLYEQNTAEAKWAELIPVRRQQGFSLAWWSSFGEWQCQGALYSPHDRWVHPRHLAEALYASALQRGVQFQFGAPVAHLHHHLPEFDLVVVSAGMGSNALVGKELLQPVRGMAVEVYLPELHLQHVVHTENAQGEDINIVPLGNDRYWVGATVEFDLTQSLPDKNITWLRSEASKFCPRFAQGEIIRAWQGDRPRPKSMSAPVIGFWGSERQIILATGHYRNGILMAPITAQIVQDLILRGDSDLPYKQSLH